MEMFVSVLLLSMGFVMLVKGADWFVEGASGIAESGRTRLHVWWAANDDHESKTRDIVKKNHYNQNIA